ncbi:hypothetical protein CRE_03475 [Caenorhabditis remanei]|uniref:Mutator-like transposase domain-containing protein n=1 Tax=Caenorhabditis remanei TaxID=31234 RepID=E3NGN6_CAERE|nr:hypothetical protein CRE_03475 [Caenorhabditis remanei]
MPRSKCAYCLDIRKQSDMTRVPRNNESLQIWFRTLGIDFQQRVLGATSRLFICREHVPKAAPRRSRYGIPYETRGSQEENLSEAEAPVYLNFEDDMLFDDDFVVVNEEVLEDKNDFEYIPTEDEKKEQEDVDLEEKDVKLIDYIIVDHSILLNAILYCRNCHSSDVGFDKERVSGANISMNLTCNSCQCTWNWCSSQRMIDGKSFMVNRDISTACSVTGMSYHKFSTCCETLRIPILTESEHCKTIRNHVAPLATEEYDKLQKEVLEIVVEEAEKRGSLDLSGDAQYDSPGFSALNCRYALIDVATNLVVDVEHVKKSSQNESSKSLEPKSLDLSLDRFVKTLANATLNVTVSSITTDRDPAVGKLLAKKYPNIKQMYDGWHFARNLQKILWKKQDQVQMKPAKRWIEPLRNHLYWSIGTSGGNGKLAVEKFLSFFYHTQNIHDNFKEIGGYQFSTVFHCDHGNINGSGYFDIANPHHKKAWELLLDMATEKKRLKDLEHVSPFFSTSQVESFNNVALTYHPKNTFFRAKSFSLRVKLSVIHWNNLKLEERMGIRQVAGKKSHFNKSLKKVTHRKFLSPGSFDWRRRILELAREHRAETNKEEEEEEEDDEQEEICIDFLNSYNADLRVWEKRDDCDFSDEFDDSYDEGTDNAT